MNARHTRSASTRFKSFINNRTMLQTIEGTNTKSTNERVIVVSAFPSLAIAATARLVPSHACQS